MSKKLGIIIIAFCMAFGALSFIILKPESIRPDEALNAQSLKQVKEFTAFIETRPELAQEKNYFSREVASLPEQRSSAPTQLHEFWKQSDFENLPEYQSFVKANGEAIMQYLLSDYSQLAEMNDQSWAFTKKTFEMILSDRPSLLSHPLSQLALELSTIDDETAQNRAQEVLQLYLTTDSLPKEQLDVLEQVRQNQQSLRREYMNH